MKSEVEQSELRAIIRVNFSEDWAAELGNTLARLMSDPAIRAVILEFKDEEQFAVQTNSSGEQDLPNIIKNSTVPVILLIKTAARGFLFEIVLAAHLCLAADPARFEVQLTANLKKKIGSKNAESLFEPEITAEKAARTGIINRAVPPPELKKAALELAEKITALAPLAIQSCLRAVRQGLETSLKKGLDIETELFTRIFNTADMREGTRAFLEKRPPVFRGK